MDFESLLSRLILAAALIAGLCLLSLVADRRRRRSSSVFRSPAFREAHVQPTQKAAPTVADVIPVDRMNATEYERASNHRWF